MFNNTEGSYKEGILPAISPQERILMKHDSFLKFKKLVGAAGMLVLRQEQSVKDLQESVGVSLMRYR
jgi:hypothetical protein